MTTSLEHCSRLLHALASTLRTRVDEPQLRAYHRALQHVSPRLLARAIDSLHASCEFFPKPVEILRACEHERQRLLTAYPFTPCVQCEHSPGWREIEQHGATRMTRCDCYRQWLQRLDALGVSVERLLVEPPRIGEVEA